MLIVLLTSRNLQFYLAPVLCLRPAVSLASSGHRRGFSEGVVKQKQVTGLGIGQIQSCGHHRREVETSAVCHGQCQCQCQVSRIRYIVSAAADVLGVTAETEWNQDASLRTPRPQKYPLLITYHKSTCLQQKQIEFLVEN